MYLTKRRAEGGFAHEGRKRTGNPSPVCQGGEGEGGSEKGKVSLSRRCREGGKARGKGRGFGSTSVP
jgi:hypothetical protein